MDKQTRRRQDAHKSVLQVASENRAAVEASPGGTKALADLTSEVADGERLRTEQSEQLIDQRKAFKLCAELRRTLYDVLKAVVKISASVVLDTNTAELMKLPRFGNDGKFIDDARAIRNVLTQERQPFLDAGLAARVFVDLPKLIDDFAAAKDRARSARERIKVVLHQAHERLAAGDKAVNVIEAILATSAEADPIAVKRLRIAKRVGPSKATATTAAAEPAAAANPRTPATTVA